MQITVSQHIYSSVPQEQSPNGRRGYQTLFYTQDALTREDVFILADRAQYHTNDTEPVKYQFFMLSEGKAVISQIVPLAELDEFGRKGRYLAHSLILSATDFKALEFSPWGGLQQKAFISTLTDAFQQGEQNGNIAPKTINVSTQWQNGALQIARSLNPKQLETIARLGWQA